MYNISITKREGFPLYTYDKSLFRVSKIIRAFFSFTAVFLLLAGCNWVTQPSPSPEEPSQTIEEPSPSPSPEPYVIKDPAGETLETRFKPPEGFTRVQADESSFAEYLRSTPLKPDGDVVYLYDGTIKPDDNFEAVMKMTINNNRNLMRNVHFLMRMRAEYHYQAGRYDDIEFHFLSGFAFDFATWAGGSRLKEANNKVQWQAASAVSDDGPESFKEYLKWVYIYTNTAAIKQDLVQSSGIAIGSVFITSGGAIVADMAEHEDGSIAVLLLRAGDPEQEGYVVKNTGEPDNSPWFIIPPNGILQTPEGELSVGDIYEFKR